MKMFNFSKKAGLLGLALAAGFVGCSNDNSSVVAVISSEKTSPVDIGAAKARMALCSRNVTHFWKASEIQDTLSVAVDESFFENSFGVEADVIVLEDQGYITLASAGVDGDQDAWALRVENGKPLFAWRDASTDNQWFKVETDVVLEKDSLITVRAERVDSLTVLYVDGEVVAAAVSSSEINTLNGRFTIGFDPTQVSENTPGRVMCVRFEKVRNTPKVEEESVGDTLVIEEIQEPLEESPDTSMVETPDEPETPAEIEESHWIAAWEFNDSKNPSRDFTGNGHNGAILGTISVKNEVAKFDGRSGMRIELEPDMAINNFVVEARVNPSKFGTFQNILVAEPPGRYGDGWMLRVDDGLVRVHFRDAEVDGTEWRVFDGKPLTIGQWSEIRVERLGDSLKVFQDGELTIAEKYKGDISQMSYDWGIGYDAMEQAYDSRYFTGEIDYIRFGSLEKMSAGTIAEKSPYVTLAYWEFNDPTFLSLDKMGNNNYLSSVGAATSVDGALQLDGESGMIVPLNTIFKRNEFAVEVRMMPTAFKEIQNVVVAEPPGRFGDGWMIRLDDGQLTVHFRDADSDGIKWNTFACTKGKIALNEWTKILLVRSADSISVYQDGELLLESPYDGDVSQLGYDLAIGTEAVNQDVHDRGFVGAIDYVRYYGIRK